MPPRDPRNFETERGSSRDNGARIQNSSRAAGDSVIAPAKTILVVDDEPSILAVRRMVFEARGYSVLTAEGGREALALMESMPVQAVILDYRMPEMDGEETAICIRNLYGQVPIILSSGCVSVPQQLMDLVNISVHKGASPQILIDAVQQQLQAGEPIDSEQNHSAQPMVGPLARDAAAIGFHALSRSRAQ
jgi:CheY-like chemotaxis protein